MYNNALNFANGVNNGTCLGGAEQLSDYKTNNQV